MKLSTSFILWLFWRVWEKMTVVCRFQYEKVMTLVGIILYVWIVWVFLPVSAKRSSLKANVNKSTTTKQCLYSKFGVGSWHRTCCSEQAKILFVTYFGEMCHLLQLCYYKLLHSQDVTWPKTAYLRWNSHEGCTESCLLWSYTFLRQIAPRYKYHI